MNDMEIQALTKLQMMSVIQRQEEFIMKLTAEKAKRLTADKDKLLEQLNAKTAGADSAGQVAESSAVFSGVFQAAQEAADMYLANIKAAEAEKEEIMKKMEQEAQEKALSLIKETAQKQSEVMTELQRLITAVNNLFDMHLIQLSKARKDFRSLIESYGLADLVKEED